MTNFIRAFIKLFLQPWVCLWCQELWLTSHSYAWHSFRSSSSLCLFIISMPTTESSRRRQLKDPMETVGIIYSPQNVSCSLGYLCGCCLFLLSFYRVNIVMGSSLILFPVAMLCQNHITVAVTMIMVNHNYTCKAPLCLFILPLCIYSYVVSGNA